MNASSAIVRKILEKIESEYMQLPSPSESQEILQKSKKTQKPVIDRQTYIQNIEKKLNEITVHSLEAKKVAFSSSNKKLEAENNEIYKKPEGKKEKRRICRLFFTTGICRWGEKCDMAHGIHEIGIEYQPKLWVSHFKNKKELKLKTDVDYSCILKEVDKIINKVRFYSSKVYSRKMKKGRTLLMEAILKGDYKLIKELISQGACAIKQDWAGYDSIMLAIKKNDWESLTICLDYSKFEINLDCKFTSKKVSYLILAAQNAQSKIVKCLLYHKANPNICDSLNRSPLFYSVSNNDFDTLQALVNEGADLNIIDIKEKTALDIAFANNNPEMIEYLFMKGGSMADNTKHKNLLFLAGQHNRRNLINEVVKRGVLTNETDDEERNILIISYENGHEGLCIEMVEEFSLSYLINQPCKKGYNVFTLCAKQGNFSLLEFFISKPCLELNFRDKQGKTALIYAAELGNDMILEKLLNKGADPNVIDKFGETALIIAAKFNQILCVENLLKLNGINVKWRDNLNMSARNHAKSIQIRKLISIYMVEHEELSESLVKEMETSQRTSFSRKSSSKSSSQSKDFKISFSKKFY